MSVARAAPGSHVSAAATHPYTLYATIVFTLVVTYGLVMMASEQAGRKEAAQFAES